MKFYIKQLLKGRGDHFSVKDEMGKDVYKVNGPSGMIQVGLQLSIFDMDGKELVKIAQKGLSLNHFGIL